MKTAKEKAIELVDKFLDTENEYKEHSDYMQSKQCALIAVDEMLNELAIIGVAYPSRVYEQRKEYLNEVRSEIEKL